jgi:hypothetical protein
MNELLKFWKNNKGLTNHKTIIMAHISNEKSNYGAMGCASHLQS